MEAGQAFLILPGELTTYTADSADPWHYCWIGFDGMLSAAFSRLEPVMTLPGELFAPIINTVPGEGAPEYRLAAMLFGLYDRLLGNTGNRIFWILSSLDKARINATKRFSPYKSSP